MFCWLHQFLGTPGLFISGQGQNLCLASLQVGSALPSIMKFLEQAMENGLPEVVDLSGEDDASDAVALAIGGGMPNLGHPCFITAVVQMLSVCQGLVEVFGKKRVQRIQNRDS